MGKPGLEEDRIHTELGVQQRHVAIHFDKEVDAFVSLMEVRVIMRKGLRTARAAESPARSHLWVREHKWISREEFLNLGQK